MQVGEDVAALSMNLLRMCLLAPSLHVLSQAILGLHTSKAETLQQRPQL